MKNSLKTRLYIGFSIAILMVIGGGIFTYITFKKQRSQAEWVEHSYEVITTAQRISRYVYEIESAGTAYRSTHLFKYLDPYFEIHPKILPAFYDLRKLVLDNADQLKRTIPIEKELIGLLNYWEGLGVRHDTNYVFSHVMEITKEERAMLEKVHADIQDMIVEERLLLAERNGENTASVSRASTALIFNTAFILLVAITLMVVSFREFNTRLQAQKELQVKLRETESLNDKANSDNWLLTGMSLINDSLQGDATIDALSSQNLQALVNYLDLPGGAFYCYEEDTHLLQFCAGKGLPATFKKSYALNEGITGEAATQKELTVIKDVPASYWRLESATGNNTPGTIVCLPLWHDNGLAGLIELVSFAPLSERAMELLRNTAHAIAVAVNAATSRKKVMELLSRVQDQKETLEMQQEELRQSNEELTRQSEILQASEEELRVQEEELRQVNDEISVQNKALEMTRQELSAKAEELEQSSKYKSEFLANMSHELRTPLNSVLILARLLEENKEQNLSSRQIEYAGIIHKSGSDLLKLINDILDLSKIEAGKVEINIEPVAVRSITSDLEQLFHVVAEEKQINFITNIDPAVPTHIHTDGQRLEQVIKNLLSNAFKFTPKEGTIELAWTMHADGLHISVSDTGAGIPADKQQFIFEAFRQADGSTSRKYGGTGLGLSISKELMKRLGGEIRLVSAEGQGSTFTIVMQTGTSTVPKALPARVEASPVKEVKAVALPEEQHVDDDRNSLGKKDKLILIIEDDASFAAILRDFARQKGFKTIVALNGNDGLFFARKFLPAAIILDMNLPLIDGNSILKILKNNEELKHILVHVVSAGEISLQVRGKVEGYTQKPLQVTDLETVFSGISSQLEARLKRVLVISDGVLLHHPFLQSLSDERQLQTRYHLVKTLTEAVTELQTHPYDGIVLDAGTDISESLARLNQLKQINAARDLPVIVYLDHDISEADELALKKNAAAIVRNSTFSGDRLMDELELFLYKLNESAIQQPTDRTPKTERNLDGQKVLLADDDMRNVFSLSALLAAHGMDVVTAADGKEALEKLEENPDIRLVLMDIMMPEMDGYEAMRRIRANARYQNLPVIALTAKAMAGDREKCIAAGASDYIAKPIDSSKLLSLMHVWIV
ncbi:response regulator [Chitinophaga sp.]|uniref:response regulator n=1 Tax=Chitinophaga sp. TaxID=1869181 RepID=UPI0031D4FB6E